jgi:DNA-binding response OmpR family regulator
VTTTDQSKSGPAAAAILGYALLIEDEPLIAASIEDELRDLGFTRFESARNEREALVIAEREPPAFISVDAKLEEGSGLQALVRICAGRAVPAIVITGNPFDVSVPGVVTLGKPFTTAAFVAAYQHAIAKPFQASDFAAL